MSTETHDGCRNCSCGPMPCTCGCHVPRDTRARDTIASLRATIASLLAVGGERDAEISRLRAALADAEQREREVRKACGPIVYLADLADEKHTRDNALMTERVTAGECRAIRAALDSSGGNDGGEGSGG